MTNTKEEYSIQTVDSSTPLNFSAQELTPEQEADLALHPVHFNLRTLSYSGLLTLHNCPRKFELQRLMPRTRVQEDDAGHLSFGTVVGNGIQEYLISGRLDRAIFRAFLDWKEAIDEDKAARSNKTFWHAVRAIEKFVEFKNTYLRAYDLAVFEGKPATELGFDIDFGEGFHYRGKIDALLIHRIKKEFLVLECKTTGLTVVDEAMYKNSSQALGYGLVIDKVAADLELSNSYEVLYPVYKTRQFEWHEFKFPKSAVQRAAWLQAILIDCGQISQFAEINYFPTHGESCYSFGRQCQFFGMCTLSNQTLFGDSLDSVEIKFDKPTEYPFKFSIQELIAAQLEKA